MQVTVNMPPAAQAGQASQTVQAGTLAACGRCQQTNPPGARFCSACGAAL
jgi:hypothetical protein